MGIGGLALAWRRAAAHWGLPDVIWQVLAGAAAVVFLLVALLYAVKLTRFPVSYTHLRAHETVLDLVCRLLLDTKQRAYTHLSLPLHFTLIRTQDMDR